MIAIAFSTNSLTSLVADDGLESLKPLMNVPNQAGFHFNSVAAQTAYYRIQTVR